MSKHTCPWWLGHLLVSPLRRLMYDPARIVKPYAHEGMTVLEPGPGMGFFTLELARRVGGSGRVIAVDLQPRMLSGLRRRVERAGLAGRVEARLAPGNEDLGIADLEGKVDLAFAFAVVHEVADPARFFAQVRRSLAPDGKLLVVEPRGHVRGPSFESTLETAQKAGFRVEARPKIARDHAAILTAAS